MLKQGEKQETIINTTKINGMSIRIISTLLFLLFFSNLKAQITSDYFITQTWDTIYGYNLKYGTGSWGGLNYLSYDRPDGNPVVYKSKKQAPVVLSLYIDGKKIDRIPLRPNSKKEIRYLERTIDGHLIVYLQHQNSSTSSSGTAMYIFYLKMPDGRFYKINDKRNMSEVIIPYLKGCEAFVNEYTGDYSKKEEPFMKMIKLYNQLCPEVH